MGDSYTVVLALDKLNAENGSPKFIIGSHFPHNVQLSLIKKLSQIGDCVQPILQTNEYMVFKDGIIYGMGPNPTKQVRYYMFWRLKVVSGEADIVDSDEEQDYDAVYSVNQGISAHEPKPPNLLKKYKEGYDWTLTINEFVKWYKDNHSSFSEEHIMDQLQSQDLITFYTGDD